MKFLSLALALLLAVGTQASVNIPFGERVHETIMSSMGQLRTSVQKVLNQLDDTEYKVYKDKLTLGLDGLKVFYVNNLSTYLVNHINAVDDLVGLRGAVAGVHDQVVTDVQELRKRLESKSAELGVALEKQVEEYRAKLDPVIQEYVARENIDVLKAKMYPIMEEMKTRVSANVQETRPVLDPMVETVRARLAARLEDLRTMVAPYAEAYKEQMFQAARRLKETRDFEDLRRKVHSVREKVEPAAEEARVKLIALYQRISEVIVE